MGDAQQNGGWFGLSDFQLAYALFRFTLGINILGHGLVRLIYSGLFEGHLLPMWLVHSFLYVLPYIEVVLGGMTAVGFKTRHVLVGGTLMMFVLVFGNLARQAWETVGNNMHYVLYFCLLLAAIRYNCLALDTRKA
jgi:thiosulfate dehydrogenase [quinone] large subunit